MAEIERKHAPGRSTVSRHTNDFIKSTDPREHVARLGKFTPGYDLRPRKQNKTTFLNQRNKKPF